jgi:hypothetical protein
LAKDRTPVGTSGKPAGPKGRPAGRTRPVTQVVAPSRPWGLIAAAVVVVVFAVAVIGYAVSQVNKANADKISSPGQITGLKTFKYASGQSHVSTPVTYKESPPVGGPHDPVWADCTGTVYTVDIRHENAVHAEEHGAVWITYNPDKVSKADVATLAALVRGVSHRMMSPSKGLDVPISVQSWNHQLQVTSATDKRIKQFADFFTQNDAYYPEVGASCVNAGFVAHPLVVGDASSQSGPTDPATTPPTMPSTASKPAAGTTAATTSPAG